MCLPEIYRAYHTVNPITSVNPKVATVRSRAPETLRAYWLTVYFAVISLMSIPLFRGWQIANGFLTSTVPCCLYAISQHQARLATVSIMTYLYLGSTREPRGNVYSHSSCAEAESSDKTTDHLCVCREYPLPLVLVLLLPSLSVSGNDQGSGDQMSYCFFNLVRRIKPIIP